MSRRSAFTSCSSKASAANQFPCKYSLNALENKSPSGSRRDERVAPRGPDAQSTTTTRRPSSTRTASQRSTVRSRPTSSPVPRSRALAKPRPGTNSTRSRPATTRPVRAKSTSASVPWDIPVRPLRCVSSGRPRAGLRNCNSQTGVDQGNRKCSLEVRTIVQSFPRAFFAPQADVAIGKRLTAIRAAGLVPAE